MIALHGQGHCCSCQRLLRCRVLRITGDCGWDAGHWTATATATGTLDCCSCHQLHTGAWWSLRQRAGWHRVPAFRNRLLQHDGTILECSTLVKGQQMCIPFEVASQIMRGSINFNKTYGHPRNEKLPGIFPTIKPKESSHAQMDVVSVSNERQPHQ